MVLKGRDKSRPYKNRNGKEIMIFL